MPATAQPGGLQRQPPWLSAMPLSGERYVLGPLLGQGGAGEVREAWDRVLCRAIAIKLLHKMDPVELLRFMREAQAQSRAAHPNICQIYDVDTWEGAPRITMQLVRGPTLADAAADLEVRDLVRILALVADAVHFAHGRNLIHRDLKPSNILLEWSPEGGWTPYVCDFGLALAQGDPTLTAAQNVRGTPAYMAPEQLQDDRSRIGPATDVYALGGTLRFALRGRLESHPRPPRQAERDLEAILSRCLDPDPERRYPSAGALASDLWLVHAGKPIPPRPDRRARPQRWWVRGWKPLLLAALAAGGLGLGLALEQRHQAAAAQVRAQWAGWFLQEAADMEKQLRLEQLQPEHDLRQAHARIRARLGSIQARMRAQGAPAQGPGHYALGEGRWLLGDAAGARAELEQAWTLGFRAPEAAWLLARALAAAAGREALERTYASGSEPAPAELEAVTARTEALFAQARHPPGGSDDFAAGLVAFLRQDYAQAAGHARTALVTHPWPSEAAALEALSLAALGRRALLAEARYGEALAAAQGFLETDPGDEGILHACQVAARELAALRGPRGRPGPASLRRLLEDGARALRLNPESADLQDDWLRLRILEAQALMDRGLDPQPALDPALAILAGRNQEPMPVPLRADRMVLHWLRAEWAFRRGQDPGPALRDALRDPGHTPFLDRDYLGELLNLKARIEARDGDPRPTLADALARMEPLLGPQAPRSLYATAAESWSIRARWEAAHGLDPGPSLQRSRILAGRAVASGALALEPR